MSNKVAVITDSTAYLPETLVKQYNIFVTPLSIIWGEDVYRDGVDISPVGFYEHLPKSISMPTTSQTTPGVIYKAFQPLLEQGYDVLGLFLSSRISGTFQSAIQTREMATGAAEKIALVDSLLTTMAMGWSVLTAAPAAQTGAGLTECQKIVE